MKVNKILPVAILATLGMVACGPSAPTESESATKPVVPETSETTTSETKPTVPELTAPATLNVWATEAEEAVLKKVVKIYNDAHADTKITVNYTGVNEGEAATNVLKDPTAKTAPDLVLVADDRIYDLQKSGVAMPMGGYYGEQITNNNSGPSIAGASYGGKIYGFPVTNDNGYFTWYDKTVINAEQAKSLEDLLATAKTAGKKVIYDFNTAWYAPAFIMSPDACGLESARWKADDNNKISYDINWDNETGVKVSEYVTSLLKPYYDNGTLIAGNNDAIVAGFLDKSVCAAISGTWMESMFDKTDLPRIAATRLPSYHIDGKAYRMASFTGSKVFVVNNLKTREQKVAATFLADLLTNKESQLVRFETRQTLPCNNEAAKDPRYTENVTIGGAALVAQTSDAGIIQSATAEQRFWDAAGPMLKAYVTGNLGDAANWQEFLKVKCDALRTAL